MAENKNECESNKKKLLEANQDKLNDVKVKESTQSLHGMCLSRKNMAMDQMQELTQYKNYDKIKRAIERSIRNEKRTYTVQDTR